MGQFRIQQQEFSAVIDPREDDAFTVRSVPRPYRVEFPVNRATGEVVGGLVREARHAMLVADQRVWKMHLASRAELAEIPRLLIEAREENKGIAKVLEIVEFLEENRATKSSMLFVVGGGIIQDLGAVAAYLYKRGIPWTFVPSTLLAQGDSGIGGKTALNHKKTKNLLALFSAPRRVVIVPEFLDTLSRDDVLSGMGEVFRLHLTGGEEFLSAFERELPLFSGGSKDALRKLIVSALSVKRAVIEHDEFELDLRRAMNFGHSFGHALEALVDFRIPHGVAVTIGACVENEISMHRGMLPRAQHDRLLKLAAQLVPEGARRELAAVRLDGVLELLRRDKKTEGNALKLVVVERVGQIRFVDLELNEATVELLRASVRAVVDAL